MLIRNDGLDFREKDSKEAIGRIVRSLYDRKDELRLADIRSIRHPFGIAVSSDDEEESLSFIEKRLRDFQVAKRYVGQKGDEEGHITRLDFLSKDDPFSRNGIAQLAMLQETATLTARKELPGSTRIYSIGPTPSIQDLKATTDRDQIVVDCLVLIGVFLILVVLLWKVPTFLFTILIAVGEDYNIFLMTRIREEQLEHGPVKGVIVALTKTGSIISSCGIIMAGTFSSLLAGTLVGMHQLGFALAFGVLLDTFVVRPILVPAFLVLLYEGRFQVLGQLAGVLAPTADEAAPAGATADSPVSPEPVSAAASAEEEEAETRAVEPEATVPDEAESVQAQGES